MGNPFFIVWHRQHVLKKMKALLCQMFLHEDGLDISHIWKDATNLFIDYAMIA